MNPLNGLSHKEKIAFVASLSEEDQNKLSVAMEYFLGYLSSGTASSSEEDEEPQAEHESENNNQTAAPAPDVPSYAKPGPYVTPLSEREENNFQSWVKKNDIPSGTASGTSDPQFLSPDNDYDMRGFYKDMLSGGAKRAENLHFPDTYKTPYHKTFSRESKYATADAPHWEGNRLIDKRGRIVADETK